MKELESKDLESKKLESKGDVRFVYRDLSLSSQVFFGLSGTQAHSFLLFW